LPADALIAGGLSGRADISVRDVPVAAIRPLRHSVLRPNLPFARTFYPEDERPETWHLAACIGDEIIGIVTCFPDHDPEQRGRRAARFRGMAVAPPWQARGIGRLLLRTARDRLLADDVQVIWAHGRDLAIPFYEHVGFHTLGGPYIDEPTGIPHQDVIAILSDLRL
jgi:GNAT superfamily N-acetyltransferase